MADQEQDLNVNTRSLLGRYRLLNRFFWSLCGSAVVMCGAVVLGLMPVAVAAVLVVLVSIIIVVTVVLADEAGLVDLYGNQPANPAADPVPRLVVDAGQVLRHNRAFAQTLLADDTSFVGQDLADLIDREHTASIRAVLATEPHPLAWASEEHLHGHGGGGRHSASAKSSAPDLAGLGSSPDAGGAKRSSSGHLVVWRGTDDLVVVTQCWVERHDRRSGRVTWSLADVTQDVQGLFEDPALNQHDRVTGLLSREGLIDRFDDCRVGSQVLCVKVGAPGDFSGLGEGLGQPDHRAFDDLMAHIGNEVSAVVGDEGLVCRYTEEQVIAVLPEPVGQDAAAVMATDIHLAVSDVVDRLVGSERPAISVGRAELGLEDTLAAVVERSNCQSRAS